MFCDNCVVCTPDCVLYSQTGKRRVTMTRDEILAMEPGIEMDMAVAEAAGWDEERDGWWIIDDYSTDIRAAWRLIDYLREIRIHGKEYAFVLFVQHDGECEVEVMLDEDSVAWVGGKYATDTMPEAICKAYLLAVTQCD